MVAFFRGIGGWAAGRDFVLSVFSMGVAYEKFPGISYDKTLLNIFSSFYSSAFEFFHYNVRYVIYMQSGTLLYLYSVKRCDACEM